MKADHASVPRRLDRPRKLRKACAAILATMLFYGPVVASAAIDKNAAHQEMLGLAQQMTTLKPQIRTNAQAAATYAAAESRYRELATAMGGDDPGRVGLLVSSAAAAAVQPLRPKVVPATPAGCGPATATFTQATPVTIPGGPAVVTSTIVVSGAGSYLFDLDMTTFITHTFPGDLDITLTSPAGTVVTITTDNAGTNDDVYNGTVWDDDANPAGQVPYTTNNGMVTDHAYAIGVLASPLTPEEPLGAFIGENPNGTWTLTISDDTAVDGGSLNSWSLAVTTFASAPSTANTTVTQSTPVTIPGGPAVVTSTVVVAGAGTSILDVDMTTFITHTFPGDLDITLTSPAGTVVTITTDNAGTNDDVYNGTVWDDDANPAGQVPYTTNNGMVTDHAYAIGVLASPLTPEEPLAAFIGEDPNGTWTLTISDDTAVDGGSLNSWTLNIDTFGCASADLSITKDDGATGITAGGTATYTIVASNAGPNAANPASVVDNFPADLTCTWTSVPSGGATGNTAAGSGNINDTALNLPVGSSVTYTATCTVSQTPTSPVCNTATVSSSTPDPNQNNNSAQDCDTVVQSADLSMMKTLITTGTIEVGDNVTFTLKVTNNGPGNATGVTVVDNLPPNLTYVSNSCGASFAAPTLTWNVGALAAGAMATCDLTVTVTQSGPFSNTATVSGNEPDPVPGNNPGTGAGSVVSPIPTLDTVGLAALVVLLAVSAAFVLRRRRRA